MSEGLDVGLDEFKGMNKTNRDVVMFKNIAFIRESVKNDQVNRKLQYFWLLALTGVIGIRRILGW